MPHFHASVVGGRMVHHLLHHQDELVRILLFTIEGHVVEVTMQAYRQSLPHSSCLSTSTLYVLRATPAAMLHPGNWQTTAFVGPITKTMRISNSFASISFRSSRLRSVARLCAAVSFCIGATGCPPVAVVAGYSSEANTAKRA